MNITVFRRQATDFFIIHSNKLRYGQAFMVYLNGQNPIIYNSIPDYANPFYDDSKIESFFQYLEGLFSQNNSTFFSLNY